MENYNEKIKLYFQEYLNFNEIIIRKINSAKNNNYEDNFSNDLLNNKDLSRAFIFFSYIKENFSCISFDENISINKNYKLIANFIKGSFKKNEYNLLFYFQHFMMISLILEAKNFLIKIQIKGINNCSSSGLNKIKAIMHQNNNIIIDLYKNKIINIGQIVLLLNILIFWARDGYNLIDTNQIVYDLFYKLKNYYIYDNYFGLIKNIFISEVNSGKEENNLKYIFDHLNKLNETNLGIQESNLNKIIILNNDSFHDFFSTILLNMNIDIYKKYSNDFIKFCKDVIYNNFELSNIFEKMKILKIHF